MCRLSRSAALGGALPNRTYGVLKSLNVQRNMTSTSTRLAPRTEGRVIDRNWRQGLAPSTTAASYSSPGMFCSAASSIRKAKGNQRHTAVATIAQKDLL